MLTTFKKLNVGDKFVALGIFSGGVRHIQQKTASVVYGTPPYTGTVNNIDTETGIVSGCGPEMYVYRIQEEA